MKLNKVATKVIKMGRPPGEAAEAIERIRGLSSVDRTLLEKRNMAVRCTPKVRAQLSRVAKESGFEYRTITLSEDEILVIRL